MQFHYLAPSALFSTQILKKSVQPHIEKAEFQLDRLQIKKKG